MVFTRCQKLFRVTDVVLLNPTEDRDIEILKEKMDSRKMLAKQAKEAKKAGKKRPAATATSTSEGASSSESSSSDVVGGNTESESSSKRVAKQKSAEDESEPRSSGKKSKIMPASKPPRAAAAAGSDSGTNLKPGTSGYSVAKDPNASDVYKSLFTTHHTEQSQTRAHWVTYNPFYN
jgi:hypothetical protein